MRVTIYGGNGFFRHAIAHRLIKRGHEVKIIARRRSPSGGPAFMQAAPYGARQRREHLRNQEASINLVGISHNRPVDCERARIALAENDATPAAMTAAIDEALDYKTITKRIIARVEGHHFLLLEKLVHDVLDIAMEHPAVREAAMEVSNPHALRWADSVSLRMMAHREALT